ncbi:hypothetical protein FEM48_Zijuj09G0218500 [Ziziphus jujuba var. spinosa]|uniref:Uncharacterized protein n=1 Tax=Ziziphus jujuba var. spinosa TaxID=714518 RepID=A0A978UVI5_ZIZJJ|nr:hypothetical protein FEM48_Zijuj09G0218500 [Ziziphus jujuba var. spinosa]
MATQEHTQRNGDYISVSIEDDDEALAKSMEAKLYDDSPLSAKCSIFRIPEVFRRHNEKAYEPDAIAIGPFHHKKPSLQPMQKVKQCFLGLFFTTCSTGLWKGTEEPGPSLSLSSDSSNPVSHQLTIPNPPQDRG